jgi:formylglycine-generating enzyme
MNAGVPELARIPAGDFLMGTSDDAGDQRPVHRVHVSEFFIGRFPVTHDQYARFIREAGRAAPGVRTVPLVATGERDETFRTMAAPYAWIDNQPPPGLGAHPVVLVTREDAIAYCDWLSFELRRPFRLPTEAEWERAARGGVDGQRYPWGEALDAHYCNFLAEPATKMHRGTRPTGTYPPNGFGLYDMIGNVWEWVSDWYSADYYASGAARDPRGPQSGTLRLVRGGAWVNDDPDMLSTAYRHAVPPDTYAYSIGFRIACSG